MNRSTTSSTTSRINQFINTHKYAITMTAIAVVSVMVLRSKNANAVWVNAKDLDNQPYGYISFK